MIRDHMREIRVCTEIAKNISPLFFYKEQQLFCKNNGCDSSFFLFLKIWQMRLAWHCIFPPLRSFTSTSTQQSQCNVRREREKNYKGCPPSPSLSPPPLSLMAGPQKNRRRDLQQDSFSSSLTYCEFPHGGLENWKGDFFSRRLIRGCNLLSSSDHSRKRNLTELFFFWVRTTCNDFLFFSRCWHNFLKKQHIILFPKNTFFSDTFPDMLSTYV